jgi:hypothetical protein
MLFVWIALAVASAEPTVAARIQRGHAAFQSLDYDVAALEFSLAARDPKATESERLEANLWAGAAFRVVGNDTDARLHFLYVLRRDSHYVLPAELPPKITDFFALVREEVLVAEASSTPSVASTGASPLPVFTAAAGGALLVLGTTALVIAAGPFFEHGSARRELLQAASEGTDGTDAADRQAAARESWESWGRPVAAAGGVALGVGMVATSVGVAWWVSDP